MDTTALSIVEVARYLRVGRDTAYRWCRDGELPTSGHRTKRGGVMVPVDQLAIVLAGEWGYDVEYWREDMYLWLRANRHGADATQGWARRGRPMEHREGDT